MHHLECLASSPEATIEQLRERLNEEGSGLSERPDALACPGRARVVSKKKTTLRSPKALTKRELDNPLARAIKLA
jgi:hypothetical protein